MIRVILSLSYISFNRIFYCGVVFCVIKS
jgi:hypothetical protein